MSHNVDYATLNIMNYSTTEKNTGMTWIDGKPIYRKTINFGSLPNSSIKKVALNISNLDHVVDYDAVAWSTSGSTRGITVRLPYVNPSSAVYQVEIYINSDQTITIACGDNKSFYDKCYVTVYYTKTTD